MNDATEPNHEGHGSPDPVAELLRRTGRRPAVPADRAERVRVVVEARWRAEVERRARFRRRRTVAVLAAAAVLVLAVGIGYRIRRAAAVPALPAVVERVEGTPRVSTIAEHATDRGTSIQVGDAVAAGAALVTDRESRLAVRLTSGHTVRLDVDGAIRVLDDGSIALDRGAVYVDDSAPGGGAGERSIAIVTVLGTVRDVGTRFEVRALDGPVVRLRVRDGAVAFEGDGVSAGARAGEEVALDAAGGAVRRTIDPQGPEWAWIEQVVPLPEISGRPLREFLDWYAGERGLTLAFASAAVEREASATRLGGSVRGMTLDDALASVLATCGMTRRVEGGTLVVAPADRP